jgi:hypothetical protein
MSNEETFVSLSSFDYLCLQPSKRKSGSATSSFSLSRNNQQLSTHKRPIKKKAKSEISRAPWWRILIWKKNVIYGVLLFCKIQDKYA